MPCANETLSIEFRDRTAAASDVPNIWFSKKQFWSDRFLQLARAFKHCWWMPRTKNNSSDRVRLGDNGSELAGRMREEIADERT